MKMSCLPVSLYPEITDGQRTLGDWFHFAAELGLDGADMSVAHLQSQQPAYLDELRRQAEDAGVAIVMMATYTDFTHPDATIRSRQVEELRAYIDVATRLGVTHLRTTAGQAHPDVGREQGIGWAVEGLTACVDEASAAGVTLCYENHTIGYGWTYFDFSQPADIFLEIMRRTEGSGLKLLFDTANTLATGDDPLTVLDQVKHRVAVVHVNDIRRIGEFEPVLHGTGVAPIVDMFRLLVEIGFDAWVSVEEASKTGEDGFRQAIPHADQAWVKAGGRPRRK